MFVSVEFDSPALERFRREMEGAATEVEQGFPDAMEQIGDIFGDSIDEQFMTGGNPPFAALAPLTIEKRKEWEQETGQRVVADYDTPLRRSDKTRLASIATIPGVAGSAYKSDSRTVQVGPDEKVLDYVRDIHDGNEEKRIPARPFVILDERHEAKATSIAQEALDDFADRFNKE